MKVSTRLVQITHSTIGRRVAMVQEPSLVILKNTTSVYELAIEALEKQEKLGALVSSRLSDEVINYDSVYNGTGEWSLLPSFDHPKNPAACIVSGTGLTHKNSALNRQMMHQVQEVKMTDSMQMYQWGVEG
ncbi:MAG: hypothetical protein ACR2KZ_08915, partial [Segetibacter sp.]